MALSALDDRSKGPDEGSLRAVLGRAAELWFPLIERLSAKYAPACEEWAFPGAKWGWSLRIVHKKRRILYLTPQRDQFVAAVVLGDRAVEAANGSPLPNAVLAELNGAKKYAEGRGIRIEVKTADDVETVELLAAIKMAN
jgi:hypothetical protein